MKFKITQAEFDALSEDMKKFYAKEGDGFQLTVEGMEDTGALKRAKDHEKAERQKAEQKVRDLETQLGERARKDGDVTALEKSWEAKLLTRETELKKEIDGYRGQLETILVDNVAHEVASRISNAPKLILPHLRGRLKAEMVDGKLITRVLDAEGKPSASSLKDLEAEFVASTDFATIIIGSKASGSGAQGGQRGASGKAFKDMTEAERTTLYRDDPDAYERVRKI